jgi:hypothetical protein
LERLCRVLGPGGKNSYVMRENIEYVRLLLDQLDDTTWANLYCPPSVVVWGLPHDLGERERERRMTPKAQAMGDDLQR